MSKTCIAPGLLRFPHTSAKMHPAPAAARSLQRTISRNTWYSVADTKTYRHHQMNRDYDATMIIFVATNTGVTCGDRYLFYNIGIFILK